MQRREFVSFPFQHAMPQRFAADPGPAALIAQDGAPTPHANEIVPDLCPETGDRSRPRNDQNPPPPVRKGRAVRQFRVGHHLHLGFFEYGARCVQCFQTLRFPSDSGQSQHDDLWTQLTGTLGQQLLENGKQPFLSDLSDVGRPGLDRLQTLLSLALCQPRFRLRAAAIYDQCNHSRIPFSRMVPGMI